MIFMKNRKIKIDNGQPIFIIAEMACAHDGDVDKAKQLIDAAVKAGADAVQLQFYSLEALMTPSHHLYKLLEKIEFTVNQWKEIYNYARCFNIEIFACTYDIPSVELAIKLNVDGIKINSSDLSNPELLTKVAKFNKPFTIGTGASTIEEIAKAVDIIKPYGNDNLILMHGIQNFPTDISYAHINKIKIFQSLFPYPVGYQDHTDASDPFSKLIDLLAIGAGACVIEKHITLNRAEKGTDYQAALESDEFCEFVSLIRNAEKAIGSVLINPLSESDIKYRNFQKKSIVSDTQLKKGDIIKLDKVKFLRTGKMPDLSPSDFKSIEGKTVKNDIDAMHPITKELINWEMDNIK
ncbi:N-acetylneuraminate synthase [Candidatus Magnetomorum sp. HK-1]|nr:N-acetylneuraminate synthase [Candidatus Magnetomorum sp. HK-1]